MKVLVSNQIFSLSSRLFWSFPIIKYEYKFHVSPSAVYLLWEKTFYKVDTLPNVSVGYVDPVEKTPHFFHMGKLRFKALFHNDTCAIWQKNNISK